MKTARVAALSAACIGLMMSPSTSQAQDVAWLDAVHESLAHTEYQPWESPSSEARFEMVNRAHNLRATLEGDAVRVTSRGEDGWTVALGLRGWGRTEALHATSAGQVALGACHARSELRDVHGDCLRRVEIRRDGLVEWWENRVEGLEQGWTVEARPEGEGALALQLSLRGAELRAVEPRRATLALPDGGTLEYGALLAWDADGVPLDVRWSQQDGGLQVEVEDAGARYPLTIDPLLSNTPWQAFSESSSAWFGSSVSAAGDVNGDGYGDVVVGAPYFDRGTVNEGRAFLFLGSATGLDTRSAWSVPGEGRGTHFGISVSSAGDVNGDGLADVLVGGHTFSATEKDQGYAALYFGTSKGLTDSAVWMISGLSEKAFFGISVAGVGDVNGDGLSDILVGAPGEDAVYLYYGNDYGPTSKADWTVTGTSKSRFGDAVAAAGDVNSDGYADLLVGATAYQNGQVDEGAAYLYLGSAKGPSKTAAWSVEGDQESANLGTRLAGAGDVNGDGFADVLVAAPYYDDGEKNEGRVTLYYGSAQGLAKTAAWSATSNFTGGVLGAVGGAGDINGDGYTDIIAGAYGYTDSRTKGEGRVVVYLGGPKGPAAEPDWTRGTSQRSASFGYAVAGAGDVNGDGFGDVIVGSRHWDETREDEGGAFVFYGSASGFATNPTWERTGSVSDAFATSLAGADIDGDGFSDLAVASPSAGSGRVEVYRGSASGLSSSAAWKATHPGGGSDFGQALIAAGDVNGDGYADLAVGAPGGGAGSAFLHYGGSKGLGASAAWRSPGDGASSGDRVGASLGAGDVNGDGYTDLVVGAPGGERVELYLGGETGLSEGAEWRVSNDAQAEAEFGAAVAVFDVNRDGFADVVVGAPKFDNGQTDEGRVYVYLGRPELPSEKPSWEAEANKDGAHFGAVVGTAGDANRDGFGDLAIGAPGYTGKAEGEGRVYVFYGSQSGPSRKVGWNALLNEDGAQVGAALAPGGDADGDGFGDLLIAAPEAVSDAGTGRILLYAGSKGGLQTKAEWTMDVASAESSRALAFASAGDVDGDGISDVAVAGSREKGGERFVALLRADGAGAGTQYAGKLEVKALRQERPIAIGGFSDERDGFRVSLSGRSPFGVLPLKLEVEVKPLDVPFDGKPSVVSADWTPGKANGVVRLQETVTGLEFNTPYHWRARFRYPIVSNPTQAWSRWYYGGYAGDSAGLHLRTSPNRMPIAKGAELDTPEDTALDITLQAIDHEGDPLTFEIVTQTTIGTLTGSGAKLTYVPNANISGEDAFEFTVSDGLHTSKKARVVIRVAAVNDAPVANAASATTREERKVSIELSGSDIEEDRLRFSIVEQPSNGTVSERGGKAVYEPNDNFFGTDAFTYKASDGKADSRPATVSVTVENVNDRPEAEGQSVELDEDGSARITLAGSDLDGDSLSFSLGSQPRKGSLTGTPPSVTYTPEADFNGSDSFSFTVSDGTSESRSATVSLRVNAVNDAPVVASKEASVREDGSTSITLAGSDIDKDRLSFEVVSEPSNGTLSGSAPKLTYKPSADFNGSDSFTFRASDGTSSSNTATVSINVEAVNDKPVAEAKAVKLAEDGSVSFRIDGSDIDGDNLSFEISRAPRRGEISGAPPAVTYTPEANYNGSDAFTFTVSDGSAKDSATVSITIDAVNDAPVATGTEASVREDGSTSITLSGSDIDKDRLSFEVVSQPSNGTLSGSAPKLTYKPSADYNGSDSFTFRASDGNTSSNTATVSINVEAVNDAPVADAVTASVSEDGSTTVRLTGSDIDGDTLSFKVSGSPRKGSVSGDGASLTYTPKTNENGTDAFSFEVSDGKAKARGTVSVAIAPVNDAPEVKDRSLNTSEDKAASIKLEGTDVERDSLSFEIVSQPSHGALSGSGPSFTYTPSTDYNGPDSFTYRASDGSANSNTATVTIDVRSVNDAPTAGAPQSLSTGVNTPVGVTLTGSDVEGDALTFEVAKKPRKGSLSGSGANLIYTPDKDFTGEDRFEYRVKDGKSKSGTVVITIQVR